MINYIDLYNRDNSSMILTECLLVLIYSKLYIKMQGTGNKESNLKIKTKWIKYTYPKDVVMKIILFLIKIDINQWNKI